MNKCHLWKCIGFALLSLAIVAMGFVFYFLVQYDNSTSLDENTVVWISIAGFFTVMASATLSKIIISYLVEISFGKKSKKHLLFLSLFISPDYFFTAVGKDIASSKCNQNQDCVEQLKTNRKKKDTLIVTFNIFNIVITAIALFVLIFFYKNINEWIKIYLVSIITFRFISRVLEIITAFGIDVIGNASRGGSSIKPIHRICLAISSIIEIVLLNIIASLLFIDSPSDVITTLINNLTGNNANLSNSINHFLLSITILSSVTISFIIGFVIIEYIKNWRNKNKAIIMFPAKQKNNQTSQVIVDQTYLDPLNNIVDSFIWTIPVGTTEIRLSFENHSYHESEIGISTSLLKLLSIKDTSLNCLEIKNKSKTELKVNITFYGRKNRDADVSATIEPIIN